MTPTQFLDLLWRDKPKTHYILLWTAQNKHSDWFLDPAAAGEYAARANGRDIYVGLGLSKVDLGPSRRCTSEEISGLTGIGADLDIRSAAHATKPLPQTIEQALSILPPMMPPSLVIDTGNGVQVWWLFKEPYVFDDEADRKEAARVLARWHLMIAARAAARGWAYDRLADLARILRIPGTANHKDPANPKLVKLRTQSDARYNLGDLRDFMDDAGIPQIEDEEKAAGEWRQRFDAKPIVLNPAARIPQETLDAWMDSKQTGDVNLSIRFRHTWNRERHDLKDPSKSGYDMALACFGVEAGLSDQLIVDLIMHHRAKHGQKPRMSPEYYALAIAKAEVKMGKATPPAANAQRPAEPPPQAGTVAPGGAQIAPEAPPPTRPTSQPPKPPDPDAQRAILCGRVSAVFGVQILRMVKIEGKEPQYRMELADGRQIEFAHVGKLIAYESVRTALAAATGRIIPGIKPKLWHEIAQSLLDACLIEESSEELEWVGATRMYLRNYIAETGFIGAIEDQKVQEQRKPMVLEGQVAVCADHFQGYVNRTSFQALSVKAITGMLSALGAKSKRVRGPKFKDQSRWLVPTAEIGPEEFTPKEIVSC